MLFFPPGKYISFCTHKPPTCHSDFLMEGGVSQAPDASPGHSKLRATTMLVFRINFYKMGNWSAQTGFDCSGGSDL